MNDKRKKWLYVLLGVIVVYFVGDYLLQTVLEGPLDKLRADQEDVQDDIDKENKKVRAGRLAAKRLAEFESQSLPQDAELARSLYRAWLLERVEEAQLVSPKIDSSAPSNRQGAQQAISFSVRGRATLEQLTRFLFDFYAANHLHQIQSLSLTPVGADGLLDVSMSIEALILPGSQNKAALSTKTSDRLGQQTLADYRVIADRNIFGIGGGFDPAAHTSLTATTYGTSGWEAWFTLQATDQTLKLRAGDRIEVGQFAATVVSVDSSDVILDSEGERWLLSVGDKLDEAFALPPEF